LVKTGTKHFHFTNSVQKEYEYYKCLPIIPMMPIVIEICND